MRAALKVVIGVLVAGLLGFAGLGTYNIYRALDGSAGAADEAYEGDGEDGESEPPTAEEVRETARGFLAAWEAERPAEAARLTDYASAAQPVIAGYFKDAHVAEVELAPHKPEGTRVRFSVTAKVVHGGHAATWRYESRLAVVRGRTTGKALVDWRESVLHPRLDEGERLVTGTAGTPQVVAVDAAGRKLTAGGHPTLGPVLSQLRERYGPRLEGEPGIEVMAREAVGDGAETLLTLSEGRPAKLRTTLDAGLQKAAERAAGRYEKASVVAIRPSTGEILAVANAQGGEFNPALQGATAPGSTFKIVTTAALLERGVSPDSPVPCYRSYSHDQGKPFHNVEGSQIEDATFAQDFAQSCNTAFVWLTDEIGDDDLAGTARRYFGLGDNDWKTGVTTFDGEVPVASGDEKSAAMIGQGRVQMNPLNMASVAATVSTGGFRQPVIVPQSADDRPLAQAEPLPADVAVQLRSLMRLTATSGTAAGLGLPPGAGAKTGSAEIGGQAEPDSWFTAYSGDLAVAAVVPGGGHGRAAAGPLVAEVLSA